MFSSVQAVFLIDVNSFVAISKTERELEQNVARLKLGCLKLLTEFGAQSEKGFEEVRWACKYYDSLAFKPDTTRKSFVDFNRSSFDEFDNDVTDRFCKAFDSKQAESGASGGAPAGPAAEPLKPHCYILKKALQEVLLDYNWDRPDISSPVKSNRRRTKAGHAKLLPENAGPYNCVVVCTRVPQTLEEVKFFCGCETEEVQVTAEDFLGSVVDQALLKGFQEDKQIHLNFVNVSNGSVGAADTRVVSTINSGLSKLSGSLHPLSNIVQSEAKQIGGDEISPETGGIFPSPQVCIAGIGVQVAWWRKARGGRPRRPQPGPFLVWEDAEGISYLKVQLEVLAVHGSSSQEWGNAVVVGVVRTSAVSVLAVAGGTGHLYVCHAPNTVFTTLISVLAKYQLSMVLKLNCGGVAVLCPWAGGVGCLAVISASGLATPPLHNQTVQQESRITDPRLLQFVAQTVEKCLKNAPEHTNGDTVITTKRFSANQTERWFRPLKGCSDTLKQLIIKRKAARVERKAMQERLQKRYRPQIPCPLGAGEVGSVDLVDITQPLGAAGPAPKPTMSRAQQLVKKSHIVTAQQKVKEQRAEEEERVQATERRAAQASEQARKSQALESKVLNKVSDIQDTDEFIQTLKSLCSGDGIETDHFTTAQTVINLALMHIKNNNGKDMEGELRKLLGSGVIQTTVEINNQHPPNSHLHHYKLQTLLHLELLWVLGYSSSSQTEDEEEETRGSSIREHHVEEAVKMLRAISLRHNPTTMASFLQETILENYLETLGEVLVEIYEELNQPLPAALKILTGDLSSVADIRPNSVKSHVSSVVSYGSGCGSVENPGSGKSREGRRMSSRHPSLKETSKRTIVIPVVTRALRRTASDQNKQVTAPAAPSASKGPESSDNEIKKVCRNLFDLNDGAAPKPRLQRSATVGNVPVTELRRSPRKKHRKSTAITPRKSKSKLMRSSKSSLKTPVKGSLGSEKGMKTPKSKKGGVIVPETPGDKVGQTVFNKKRVRKSTGTTLVSESPDVKRLCKTTPRRLHASLTVTRRNSFYSGARSRNWERGKTQLLADRIRSHSERRSLDASALQNVGDASFLFSEILSASQSDLSLKDTNNTSQNNGEPGTPERCILDYGLDTSTEVEESSETVSSTNNVSNNTSQSSSVFTDSPAKNTRGSATGKAIPVSSTANLRRTPIKAVRRALSIGTPTKPLLVPKSPRRNLSLESSKVGPLLCTPKKGSDIPHGHRDPDIDSTLPGTPKQGVQNKLLLDSTLSAMTPSKRVQFSLTLTPSKHVLIGGNPQTPKNRIGSLSSNPQTPKSILKTPSKTPGKTPIKDRFQSPDLFRTTGKRGMQTPLKTPPRTSRAVGSMKVSKLMLEDSTETVPESPIKENNGTPVKVGSFVCNGESELELLSPMKANKRKCRRSDPLYSPDKVNPMDRLVSTEGLPDVCAETLKDISPEDVELMNSLMFGKVEEDSEIGTAEISEEDELFKLDINGILTSLSSPVKQMKSQPSAVSHYSSDELSSSSPETQTCLLDLNTMLSEQQTPVKEQVTSHIDDLLASPEITLDPKIKQYMERMNEENSQSVEAQVLAPVDKGQEILRKADQIDKDVINENRVDDKKITNDGAESNEIICKEELSESGVRPIFENKIPVKKNDKSERTENHAVKTVESNAVTETSNSVKKEEKTKKKTRKSGSLLSRQSEKSSANQSADTKSEDTKRCEKHSEMVDVSSDDTLENNLGKALVKDCERKQIQGNQEPDISRPGDNEPNVENIIDLDAETQPELVAEKDSIEVTSLNIQTEKKNRKTTKRRIFESDDEFEETCNQENIKMKPRSKRQRGTEKHMGLRKRTKDKPDNEGRSKRSCVKRIASFKEYSSEDDEAIFNNLNESADAELGLSQRRIFDDDEDFISPLKMDCHTMPLKNVENLPNNSIVEKTVENEIKKAADSVVDIQDSPLSKISTPDRCKQQKIDIYLSPINKHATDSGTVSRMTTESSIRKRPETPNDWKRVKPRTNKKRKTDSDADLQNSVVAEIEKNEDDNEVDDVEEKVRNRRGKRKRKRVKLKLTKSGDHYQVSEANASLVSSDLNSSSDVQMIQSTKNSKDAQNLDNSYSSDTPVSKKKKSHKDKSIITPLRFTRHMSKDLSVSPEFFQKLITLSPERGRSPVKSNRRESDEALGEQLEREILKIDSIDDSLSNSSSIGHHNEEDLEDLPFDDESLERQLRSKRNNVVADEWTVQNVPGSPTLKTFIRKQKNKHSIYKSPRIQLSPLQTRQKERLSKPSMLSLVHLSVSPIVNNTVNDDAHESQENSRCPSKPKSSRRLYRSSKEF